MIVRGFTLLLLLLPFCYADLSAQSYDETGKCSYYADKFQGRNCSSGEKYDKDLLTAAHLTLPFNTLVRVTNLNNEKSVIVRINDRGPHTGNRLIDLSRAAAKEIGMIPAGVVMARVEYVGMADADSVTEVLLARKHALENTRKKNSGTFVREIKFCNQRGQMYVPRGYGVQVGRYADLSECKNDMHRFTAKYGVQAFVMSETTVRGNRYSLILGEFISRNSAGILQKEIFPDIPDCFTVAYQELSKGRK